MPLTDDDRTWLGDLLDAGGIVPESDIGEEEQDRIDRLFAAGLIREVPAWQITGAGLAALGRSEPAPLIDSRPDLGRT
jgi:hypothetical protein